MLNKQLDIATFRRPAILLAGMLLTAGSLLHALRSVSVSMRDWEHEEAARATSPSILAEVQEHDAGWPQHLTQQQPSAAPAASAAKELDAAGTIIPQVAQSDAGPTAAHQDAAGKSVGPSDSHNAGPFSSVLLVSAEDPLDDAVEEEAVGETFNGFGALFDHEFRRLSNAPALTPTGSGGAEAVVAAAPQLIDAPPSAKRQPGIGVAPPPPSLVAPQTPPPPPAAGLNSAATESAPSGTAESQRGASAESAGVSNDGGVAEAKSSASALGQDTSGEQTVSHLHGYALGALTHLLDTGFYAGYEVSVLSAMDDRDASVGFVDLTTGRRFGQDADGAVGAGQRVWIGMRGPGRGFRLSYWGLDSKTLVEGPYDTDIMPIAIRGNSSLEASAVDLEVTQPFEYHASRILMSFGARYAEYEQVDTLVGFAELGNGVRLTSLSNALREMDGMGFTASLEGTHPLHLPFWAGGCGHDHCNDCGSWEGPGCYPTTGLFWFWNARGAALWGETKLAALTEATAMIPGPNDATGFASSRDLAVLTNDNESVLGNLELQLGIEYRRCLQILPSSLVLRGGLEYRRWDLGDDGVISQSFAALQNEELTQGGRTTAYAQIVDEAIDLFGVAFSVGLYY